MKISLDKISPRLSHRLEEYERRESEFAAAEGALCEDADPRECDCARCPLKKMCGELCAEEEAL